MPKKYREVPPPHPKTHIGSGQIIYLFSSLFGMLINSCIFLSVFFTECLASQKTLEGSSGHFDVRCLTLLSYLQTSTKT